MVVQLTEPTWRRAGCDDACTRRMVIVPGLLGRQVLVVHDPDAHELWGRALAGERGHDAVLESGPLIFSRPEMQIWVDGREVILTPTEMGIFRVIVAGAGSVVTYAEILGAIWGASAVGDTHLLRVNVARLRSRLGIAGRLIETVPTVGYRFRFMPPGEIPRPLVTRPATEPQREPWAFKHDACRHCGTTDRRHQGRGYCARCYHRLRDRGALDLPLEAS